MAHRSFIYIVFVLGCFLCCISCNQRKEAYFYVRYKGLDIVNGSVAYLWRYSGDLTVNDSDYNKGPIGKSMVVDGQVGFAGPEDTTHMYRIEIGGEGAFFYPERGDLTVTYTAPGDSVVAHQSSNPNSLNVQLWNLYHKGDPSVEQVRNVLFANIRNAIGCYLLDDRAVVYPDELELLYNRSNEEMRHNTSVLKVLARQLDATHLLNEGDLFIDFKQKDLEGSFVCFADIAGKGDPVALLFWMKDRELMPLRNEIECLKTKYPAIRLVIVTTCFQTPPGEAFLRTLKEEPHVTVLDDNYRFEESVRWLYRIHNTNFNYEYLFDGEGRLIGRKPVV